MPQLTCPECGLLLNPGVLQGLCAGCLCKSLLQPLPPLAKDFTATGAQGLEDYEIVEEIGRGAMGVVFRARQISLNRLVALKMISPSGAVWEADLQRFRSEAESVAQLDHPNIVPIYEVSECSAGPFFTMKLMERGSLADALKEFPPNHPPHRNTENLLPIRDQDGKQLARFMAKLANAVDHAHRHGILHRDLKPSNILLDDAWQPQVTDFGLAKRLNEESDLTLTGMVIGTPAYIAPEVALGGKTHAVTSDVYSLGAILYELLTGRPPFVGGSPMEILKKVLDEEVTAPREIVPGVDRDLETICLKALSKKPEERYTTASALERDLNAWLRHEPISARPPSVPQRVAKWGYRHPLLLTVVLLVLAGGVSFMALLFSTNRMVERANNQLRENLYAADLFLAHTALLEGNLGLSRTILESYLPGKTRADKAKDLRGFEWFWLWQRSQGEQLEIINGFPRAPLSVAIAPDGQTLVVGGQNFLSRWDASNRVVTHLLPSTNAPWLDPGAASNLLARIKTSALLPLQVGEYQPSAGQIAQSVHPNRVDTVTRISWSRNGRQVLTSTRDEGRAVRLWEIGRGNLEYGFPAIFSDAVMSPADDVAVVGSYARAEALVSGAVKVYDLATQSETWSISGGGGMVDLSADGTLLVTGGWDSRQLKGRVLVWSTGERRLVAEFLFPAPLSRLCISPDGRWLAVSHPTSNKLTLQSLLLDGIRKTIAVGNTRLQTFSFSPDSTLLATGGSDQLIRIWSVFTGDLQSTRVGHLDQIESIAFFPDGRRMASASRDGTVRLWSMQGVEDSAKVPFSGLTDQILISPNGRWWGTAMGARDQLTLFSSTNQTVSRTISLEGVVGQIEGFSNEGKVVSAFHREGAVELEWRSLETWIPIRRVRLEGTVELGRFSVRAFSPVAERYASGGSDGVVRVWSTKDGKLLHEFGLPDHIHGTARFTNFINRVTFSPNGLLLAAGIQSYSQISVFSLRDNKMLFSKHAQALSQGSTGREDPGKLRFMAFSPDNKMLISSDYSERYMRLWNTISGELVGVLQGHPGHTAEFSISPDGKTVASTGLDGSLKLWHLATRRELATLPIAGTIGPLQFSPDGTFLMAAQQDHLQFFRIKQP